MSGKLTVDEIRYTSAEFDNLTDIQKEAYLLAMAENRERAELIKTMIMTTEAYRHVLIDSYNRYKGYKPIIFKERFPLQHETYPKINNKLVSAFEKEVVDVKCSYILGVPVIMSLPANENGDTTGAKNDKIEKEINRIVKYNSLDDVDMENCKMASSTGTAYELWYNSVDPNGRVMPKVMRLNPWEVIPVIDKRTGKTDAMIRYYETYESLLVKDDKGDEKVVKSTTTYAEYYDEKNIYYYIKTKDNNFVPVEINGFIQQPHEFPFIPIVKCINNDEEMSDFYISASYIDAYDRAISDFSSEMEQTRQAYLLVYGAAFDAKTFEKLKQTGALRVDEGGKIEWLIKDINVAGLDSLLDKLSKNIIRFCCSVDFTDKDLYGNLTKMAIAYKFRLLESKAMVFERKYKTFLSKRWALLSGYMKKLGINFDYLDLEYRFTRNIPVNTVEEAETLVKHRNGGLSMETAFGQLSFIDEPQKEIDRVVEEENRMLPSINDDNVQEPEPDDDIEEQTTGQEA